MSIELSIPWPPVKALAHLAGEKDIRPWIKGVWLDSSGPTLRVMASDGGALGLYETQEPSTTAPPVFLPGHIVKAAKDFGPQATLRIDDTRHAHLESFGTRHYWQDEGLAMPDYRRAFPKTQCSGIAQQFDAELVAKFVKVRKALGKPWHAAGVRISHNGRDSTSTESDAALVTLRDVPEFAGLLLCLRQGQMADPFLLVPRDTPPWVFARAEAPAEACDLA